MGKLNVRPYRVYNIVTTVYICIVLLSKSNADVDIVHCPLSCSCDEARQLVDCSDRNLARPPLNVPKYVRFFNLGGNGIHRLAAIHLQLPNLVELNLSNNDIADLPPDLFAVNTQLRKLDLSGNRFNHIPTLALAMLTNLQELSMARNKIPQLNSNNLIDIPSLNILDLSGNSITKISSGVLDHFPRLVDLQLSGNHLDSIEVAELTSISHGLRSLDLSLNSITHLFSAATISVFSGLRNLNLTSNQLYTVEPSWFIAMPSLSSLELGANKFQSINGDTFRYAANLHRLVLSHLSDLRQIDCDSFVGLSSLEELHLSSCPNLTAIHSDAFRDMLHLQVLDLSENALSTLSPKSIQNLPNLLSVSLSGNRWYCGCQLKLLRDVLLTIGDGCGDDVVCTVPTMLSGIPLLQINYSRSSCPHDIDDDVDKVIAATLASSVALDCPFSQNLIPAPRMAWYSNHEKIVERTITHDSLTGWSNVSYKTGDTKSNGPLYYYTFHQQFGQADAIGLKAEQSFTVNERVKLLANGTLLIEGMTRKDTGRYRCQVSSAYENVTVVVELRLDYGIMSIVMLSSLVVGGASAIGFFSIAVILGAIRYFAHVCSADERAKRRSLRELLTQMRNSSQLDRLSAYRTAKMDKLSALKSATMDQLSAFTSERIGRLRKYKQATVSSVLHQLERMREHYAMQTARIKDSYANNVEHLRRSYALQNSRLHDRRSVGVTWMREQYRARAARAREYSVLQVARLRDQYKQQQQYLLKLLELIDVGSCVSSAVEAECVRAESAIFDAGVILFDEEARPSHATRTDEVGFGISDTCICHTASSLSLPDTDVAGAASTLLPRSVSTSDIDSGHELSMKSVIDAGVIVHATWQKSSSVPVICIVHQSNEATGHSATVDKETRAEEV